MNRKVLIIGAAIVVPFIILLTIGLKRDPRAIKSPLIGKPAPQFALRDVSTGSYRLTITISDPASGTSVTRAQRFQVVSR